MRLVVAASATVALLAVSPAGSATRPAPPALIAKGIARADLTPTEKADYTAVLARARAEVQHLPAARADLLRTVVADVAALWRSYTRPRALVLFSTLAFNERWLAEHPAEGSHPDLTADDGVVYRFFWSHGYVFHPLANFAKLNELAARGDDEGAVRLAQALLARAIPRGDGLVWEYEFPFASGRAPWTSGMVQAVAAQALARAGDVVSDQALLDAADAAYAAVPGLLSSGSPARPWVALYSFDRVPVLNAHAELVRGYRLHIVSADIQMVTYTAIIGDTTQETGTFKMQRKGSVFRAIIDFSGQNDAREIAFLGNIIRMYYPKLKMYQDYDVGKNGDVLNQFLLLGFGSSGKELAQSYEISAAGTEKVSGTDTTKLLLLPKSAGVKEHLSKIEMWIPVSLEPTPIAPKWKLTCWNCPEASQPAV